MKILLIGEFSGVHNNLKKGLIELGHDVKLAADGDGYRKFGFDFQISPFKGNFFGRIHNVIFFIRNIKKYMGYDVVQFINPFSLPYYLIFFGVVNIVFKFNSRSIYYICGTDPVFIKSQNKFKYFPYNVKDLGRKGPYNFLSRYYFKYFLKKIDLIIPSMYSYYKGYSENIKLTSPIPLPGSNTMEIFAKKHNSNTLTILHGITRKDFKGSEFILRALEQIKAKYNDKVSIEIVERVSFQDYISFVRNADIIVDQCKSYDYGMNAIFAMENGCIVLSGSEKIAMEYLGFNDCPVINILPDADNIFHELDKLICLDESQINELKQSSIDFVKKEHSLQKIASHFSQKYINLLGDTFKLSEK